jgi:hypothetical protein
LGDRHGMRDRRCGPGQVPSAGGPHADGRRRSCHLGHLRVVLRA